LGGEAAVAGQCASEAATVRFPGCVYARDVDAVSVGEVLVPGFEKAAKVELLEWPQPHLGSPNLFPFSLPQTGNADQGRSQRPNEEQAAFLDMATMCDTLQSCLESDKDLR
jgi:hypothetical protein